MFSKSFYIPVILFSVFSTKMFAIEARNYFYMETAANMNLYSQANVTTVSKNDKEEEIINRTTLELDRFDTFYLSDLRAGFHADNGWSFEIEYNSHQFYFNIEDGVESGAETADQGAIHSEVVSMNVKYDLWSLYNNNYNLYVRTGVGFGFFNQINQNSGNAGNEGNVVYNIGGGVAYVVNKHFDVDLYYRYLGNYAKLKSIASIGTPYKLMTHQHSLNLAARIKF